MYSATGPSSRCTCERPSIAAVSSMRLLVVCASRPPSSVTPPSGVIATTPQPPGPGLPLAAPSLKTVIGWWLIADVSSRRRSYRMPNYCARSVTAGSTRAARRAGHQAATSAVPAEERRHRDVRGRIGGSDAEQLRADPSRRQDGRGNPDGRADGHETQRRSQHEPADAGAVGSERHADRDLLRSTGDEIGHDAVDPAGRDEERDDAEAAGNRRGETGVGVERAYSDVHRRRDRPRAPGMPDRSATATRRRRERRRRAGCRSATAPEVADVTSAAFARLRAALGPDAPR